MRGYIQNKKRKLYYDNGHIGDPYVVCSNCGKEFYIKVCWKKFSCPYCQRKSILWKKINSVSIQIKLFNEPLPLEVEEIILLCCCSEREFKIMYYYLFGFTLSEIAPVVGVSRERIRQILYYLFRRLRHKKQGY
ncbi:MAG: hypothetical protein HY761_09960 [Candidatus Omnitrophica bacterium]|nr:hypothetical protein [Candidatus Omnitrophota bacterium]